MLQRCMVSVGVYLKVLELSTGVLVVRILEGRRVEVGGASEVVEFCNKDWCAFH